MPVTSELDINQLHRLGYAKLDWKFDTDWCAKAIEVLDKKKSRGEHKALIPNGFFDFEVLRPDILNTVRKVLGNNFYFHHANGYVHTFHDPFKRLHHDHDEVLSGKKDRLSMVHLLIYPAGIDDTCGRLSVVPGSHLVDVPRNLAGTSEEDRAKMEHLACGPGEVFLAYSSVWHGRREMKDPGKTRYHMNFSYCRPDGPRKELLEQRGPHDHLKSVLPSSLHGYLS